MPELQVHAIMLHGEVLSAGDITWIFLLHGKHITSWAISLTSELFWEGKKEGIGHEITLPGHSTYTSHS